MKAVAPGVGGGAGLGEKQFELDVGDDVGGHQELEAVEPRHEVAGGIGGPETGVLREDGLVADKADDLGEERPGAAGRVEDLDAVDGWRRCGLWPRDAAGRRISHVGLERDLGRVGEAVLEAEFGAQERVDAANDEADDGLRRVPDAAAAAEGGVVVAQEVLVEMDHRVARERFVGPSSRKDRANVGGAEDGGELVDEGLHAVVEVGAGNVAEERAKEGVRFGDELGRLLAVEGVGRRVVEAGGEHPVDDGLRVGVREELDGKVVDEQFAERAVLGAEGVVLVGVRPVRDVAREGALDHVVDLPGLARHHPGKFRGGLDGLDGRGAPVPEGVGEKAEGRLVRDDPVLQEGAAGPPLRKDGVGERAERDVGREPPLLEEAEPEEVREDDLFERREVAAELLGVGAAALEVVVEGGLRLEEADGDVVLCEDDVRRAAFDPLGLVRGDDAGDEALDQRLDGGAVGMLRRLSRGIRRGNGRDVGGKCRVGVGVHGGEALPGLRSSV